ncbi:MAG: nucleoside monophosphate kinase [Candidatus Woesearchaeota archaeon]|nr:MAG: nucleoside monophosphate kinase [Candidatus Woesearchaeota archaeon]
MNIIIFGKQGCGKGTQAAKLAQKFGIPAVSVGNRLRELVASGSELGLKLKSYMDKGELVPFEINVAIVKELIDTHPQGMILDGFPRNKEQAAWLAKEWQVDVVIELEISDEEAIRRILERAAIEHRSDDTPEVIQKRLDIYHHETEPLKHLLSAKKIIIIDGSGSIEAVFEQICKKL